MINICDDTKYYRDNNLTSAAKRIPRPVEDIEIVGTITRDETLDFPSLSACAIENISSITCNFYSSNLNFTVKGNGSLDPENPRQPEEDQLNIIQSGDPIRFAHGWYSINPAYTLGALITNGNVILDNIGYNNQRTDCNILTSNNSVIANNTLAINRLNLNDSFAYSSQFDTPVLNMNNSKVDAINIICGSGTYTDSSLLMCSIENANLLSNNTNYIDINAIVGSGKYTNGGIYRSTLVTSDTLSNSIGIIGTAIEVDNSAVSGCNITTDICKLKNLSLDNSTVSCNQLFTESTPVNVKNTSITASIVNHSYIINSGILNFTNCVKLHLDNHAQVNIELLSNNIGSIINNYSGGIINVTSSGNLLNGSNASGAKIIGSVFTMDSAFDNAAGAEIIGATYIINSGNNNGKITIGNFFDTSTNNGNVDTATFHNSASNVGQNSRVGSAEFFDTSSNASTGLLSAIFYNTSSNGINTSGSLIFKNNSSNSGDIINSQFYDNTRHENAKATNVEFYNSGICISGDLNGVSFYDTSQSIGSTLYNVQAYGQAFLQDMVVSTGSGNNIELNGNTSGNMLINPTASGLQLFVKEQSMLNNLSGSVSGASILVSDNAQIQNSSGLFEISFTDSATCGNSADTVIYLRNNATTTGSIYGELNTYNSSSISGIGGVEIGVLNMFDNSTCINRNALALTAKLRDNAGFYGATIVSGLITDKAKIYRPLFGGTDITFSGGTTNDTSIASSSISFIDNSANQQSGRLIGQEIRFSNNSNNYGVINGTSLFSGSVNYATGSYNTAYYIGSAFHRGSGSGPMHFGSGSVNAGWLAIAYFYSGSVNNGFVENAVFHPSVTQTGTVLDGSFDFALIWEDPF